MPPPILSVNSRQRIFNVLYEDGDPAAQKILVTNSGGGGALNWTAKATEVSGSGWLILEQSSGSTPGQLPVRVDTSTLTLGKTYKGRIEIASDGVQGSPQVLDVTLYYGTNLRFSITPRALSFYMVQD